MPWVLSLPGAPLLYYGDEYGAFGGADPDNRHMWRAAGQRSSAEDEVYEFVLRVGAARRASSAIRRGEYSTLLAEESVSPQILGVFIGVPRTEAAVTAQARDVDRMILFKRNLEKVCRTHAELVEQIQITVKHEIGHYLGLDEDDLERLGLA